MRFRLAPVARSDLLDITDYYADISEALADRFVDELDATLHGLCYQPDIGSRRYAHFMQDQSLRCGSWITSLSCCSIVLMANCSTYCVYCTNDAICRLI